MKSTSHLLLTLAHCPQSRERRVNEMLCTLKLKSITPNLGNSAFQNHDYDSSLVVRRPSGMNLPIRYRRLASLTVQSDFAACLSEPTVSSRYTSAVGSPWTSVQLSQWNLTQRHIIMLNVIACAAAVSAIWLFFSAIPTLLAFKRAAESLEKLMDVTREELPDTMAAIRLSGMEISDLTMELSDLGQDITQGVRSSTRAVRLAEERLRWLTNMTPSNINPSVSVQEVVSLKADTEGPILARTARGIREGIVKGRMILQIFFTITRFSRMALNYFAKRAKK